MQAFSSGARNVLPGENRASQKERDRGGGGGGGVERRENAIFFSSLPLAPFLLSP